MKEKIFVEKILQQLLPSWLRTANTQTKSHSDVFRQKESKKRKSFRILCKTVKEIRRRKRKEKADTEKSKLTANNSV